MMLPGLLGLVTDPHVLCNLAGIAVSAYALYVERKKHQDPKYVAMCDFNENMSCSRVLTSEYSQGFGLVQYLVGKESFLNMPNCILGIVFYSLQIILGQINTWWSVKLMFYTSAVGAAGSIYLAYILFFVLHDVCVVCMTTYVINFCVLYMNYHKLFG